ncbi:unnamed protein product, partial [Iphiclides podalirius]
MVGYYDANRRRVASCVNRSPPGKLPKGHGVGLDQCRPATHSAPRTLSDAAKCFRHSLAPHGDRVRICERNTPPSNECGTQLFRRWKTSIRNLKGVTSHHGSIEATKCNDKQKGTNLICSLDSARLPGGALSPKLPEYIKEGPPYLNSSRAKLRLKARTLLVGRVTPLSRHRQTRLFGRTFKLKLSEAAQARRLSPKLVQALIAND